MLETLWRKAWFRALCIGASLSLAFPPVNLFPMLWLGLFWLLNEIRDSNGIRHAMARVYLPMVIWNLGATYWLMMATFAGGLAAIFANAVVLAVPLGLAHPFLRNRERPWMGWLAAAAIWVVFEWIHTRWELAWPWLQLGNGLAAWPLSYQWIGLTGIFGLSFWIFVSAAAIPQTKDWGQKKAWSAFTNVFVPPLLISLILFWGFPSKPDRTVPVAVAQPNYDSYLQLAGYHEPITPLRGLFELSDSVRTEESRLLIWPENAVMADVYNHYPNEAEQLIHEYVTTGDVTLITGATFMEIFSTESPPPLVRRFTNGVAFKAYNSALRYNAVDSTGIYRKRHLVPLVETIPYLAWLDAVDVFGIDFPQMNSYHRGEYPVNFKTPYGLVPAMVCYDSVFPNWVRRTVADGAVFVAVITNDGWWGNTSGHWQHFEFARLRAVETGRAVVRSANNGISGVIDADGRILTQTKYWERTGFTADVPVYEGQTLYDRWGDWFVGLCVTFAPLAFLLGRRMKSHSAAGVANQRRLLSAQ